MLFLSKTIVLTHSFLLLVLISVSTKAGSLESNGDVLAIAIPAAAYASTFHTKDKEGRRQFYKSFLTTSLITHGLKSSIGKTRPDGSDNRSFPSGHTSASFQSAAFIHKRLGWKKAVIPYIASAYVGYTRVEANKHDWTDVAGGAVIGIASSWLLTTKNRDHQLSIIADRTKLAIRFSKQL